MSPSSSKQPLSIEQLLRLARKHHQDGVLDEAMRLYNAVLKRQPENPDALYLSGLVHYRQARAGQAIRLIKQATIVDSEHVLALASLAQIYQDRGEHKCSAVYFQRAAERGSSNASLFNGLGLSLFHMGEFGPARTAYERAIELQPDLAEAHNNLANLLRVQGELELAEKSYGRSLFCRANFHQAHNNLGVLYQSQQKSDKAIRCFEAALGHNPEYAEAYNNLGAALNDQGKIKAALSAFQNAIDINPEFIEAIINAGLAQQNLGLHKQARDTLDRALKLDPENLTARWVRCVAELETVYQTQEAIYIARDAYKARLKHLVEAFDSDKPEQRLKAEALVGLVQPFLLPYQAENDIELQSMYGDFLCALLPEKNLETIQSYRPRKRLRVGVVSAFFYDHSNWKIPIQGWLEALSKTYELTAYYTGRRDDEITAQARKMVDQFRSGLSREQFAERIREDQIDVLIYPEVGMHPITAWLAAQRLARVQCASWGHPVTSGLPCMDYFFSSDLMEPEDAQACYREKLIRLPGLSFSWVTPAYDDSMLPDRAEFGFSEQDILYLCVQNLSKYLPQHDYLLAEIARQVPNARLIFIEGAEAVTASLKQRLKACFSSAGLDFEAQIHFLPRLDRDRYHVLNRVADIFLDTLEWSGCNSTLEALHCDLPVVTLQGRWMRGRHSGAIYRKMLYQDLIANSEMHYIELAVRLGKDQSWRAKQGREIASRMYRVLEDKDAPRALASIIPELINEQY